MMGEVEEYQPKRTQRSLFTPTLMLVILEIFPLNTWSESI